MTPHAEVQGLFFDAVPVVPFLVLHRDGEIARETCAFLERFITEPLRRATRFGTIECVGRYLEETRQLPPLVLTRIPTLPTWCVWMLEFGTDTVAEIASEIEQLAREAPNDALTHLFIFHTTKEVALEHSIQLAEELANLTGHTRGFVIMTKEDSPPSRVSAVAMGIAAYLCASWQRYCEAQQHDTPTLDDALLLDAPGEHMAALHTLGIGVWGLDEAYHSHRMATKLREELIDMWLDPNCGVVPGLVSPPNEQLLSSLLPQPEFTVSAGEHGRHGNELILGEEIHTLQCHLPLPAEPSRKRFSAQEHLMLEFRKLCSHHFISQVNHLPQAERVISLRSKALQQRLREPIDQYLESFAPAPRGFIQGLKERLDRCRDHVADLVNARAGAPEHHQPFAAIQNLRARIMRLPNLPGGLVRYIVLLALLGALLLHSQLTNIFSALWDEAIPRYWTLALTITTASLGVGIVWFFVDRVHRIFQLLDHLREAIHGNLLLKLTKLLCNRLRASAKPLLDEIATWAEVLERVRLELGAPVRPTQMPVNTRTEFSDEIRDKLLMEHQSALVQQLHDAWVRKHGDFPILMRMSPTDWLAELHALARTLSADTLNRLTFDELARHAGWNRAQKQRCLMSAIEASRHPTLPVGAALMPRCLCIVSAEWERLGERHRHTEFFELPVPVLIAISPIPVPLV